MTRQKTLVTDDRIQEFLAKLALRGRRQIPAIRALCLGERNFLKNAKYVKRGADPKDKSNETTLSLTRRHKIITMYRNAIREKFGDAHPALRYMLLSEKESEERNAGSREVVVARHSDRRPIEADVHVSAAVKVLETDGSPPLLLAAALIALTGRRPIEILLTGNFKEVKTPAIDLFDKSVKERWSLEFSGQAKTRGVEGARTSYEIPVLADPKLIVRAFKALRTRYDCANMTPQQVGDRAWKNLGTYSKSHFVDRALVPITPSGLRAAYATIAYEWFAPLTQSWNAYTARILGHSVDDLTTSFSYDQFYPVGSKREYDREIHAATRETLDALRRQRANETDPTKAGYLDEKIAAAAKRLEPAETK